MDYIFNLANHIVIINEWASLNNARFEINTNSLRAIIIKDGVRTELHPRFIKTIAPGRIGYTRVFEDGCNFVGWLPYELRRWPIATDKVIFKRFCQRHSLLLPRIWYSLDDVDSDFIVKTRAGSFGLGQQGPFKSPRKECFYGSISETDLLEEFIVGTSVKIWYWGDKPVALVDHPPIYIVGDGKSTLAEIASSERFSFDKKHLLDRSAQILAWQGYGTNTILPKGSRAQLDYQHISFYAPLSNYPHLDELKTQDETTKKHIDDLGRIFSAAIPDEFENNVIYVVDAVKDENSGKLFLLELNCNPVVHPKTYTVMLDRVINNQK